MLPQKKIVPKNQRIMTKNYCMKWLSLLLTLSIFSLNQLSAQGYSNVGNGEEGPLGLILGLSGDVGGSSITQSDQFQAQYTSEQYNEPSLFSFGVGVNAGVRLNNFYLLTGASYISRGGRVEGRVLGENYTDLRDGIEPPLDDQEVFIEDRTTINMLKIPVLAAYRFGSKKFAFRLSLGVAFNSTVGDRATFEREAEWRSNLVDGDFVSGGRTNSDLYGIFLYGDDSRARFVSSSISFIFNPSIVFQLKRNSHLKIGVVYESFGDISNDRFSSGGSGIVTGDQKMSYFGVQVGYEYRIEFANY